jgi:tRNA pseudouridine65 synthase
MTDPSVSSTLACLYRDAELVVVDKPSGLLVHRGAGPDEVVAMTLVRDMIGQWVYLVHRLDRGTSGVLVFALSGEIAALLQQQFQDGSIDKRYLALVRGVAPEEARIDAPVPNDEGGEKVPALTEIRRLAVFERPEAPFPHRYSAVSAHPFTGRRHQIRRHMRHVGCPLIGDTTYGRSEHNRYFAAKGLGRLALHAHTLQLRHPVRGEKITFTAPVPVELSAYFGMP